LICCLNNFNLLSETRLVKNYIFQLYWLVSLSFDVFMIVDIRTLADLSV
jgi:hypothetical protein